VLADNFTVVFRCIASNCTNSGFYGNSASCYFIECGATGCSTQPAFFGYAFKYCEAYSNTITGFSLGNGGNAENCIARDNSGASTDGIYSGVRCNVQNCTAVRNGQDGFSSNAGDVYIITNSASQKNGRYGFFAAAKQNPRLVNCASYDNTSGHYPANVFTAYDLVNFQEVTDGSVFVDDVSDCELNSTALRGAMLRGAGSPQQFPSTTSDSRRDIGAVQHADPAGGGGGFIQAGSGRFGVQES
jgi:hypothetical protein